MAAYDPIVAVRKASGATRNLPFVLDATNGRAGADCRQATPELKCPVNAAIPRRFPKKAGLSISSVEHFEEMKEAEIIDVCQNASLFSKNLTEILREKLKKRNIAAHPSQVVIQQFQADDVITDLINNVVLALV